MQWRAPGIDGIQNFWWLKTRNSSVLANQSVHENLHGQFEYTIVVGEW